MIHNPAIIHINLFAPISLEHISATWAPNFLRVRSFVKANGHASVGKNIDSKVICLSFRISVQSLPFVKKTSTHEGQVHL